MAPRLPTGLPRRATTTTSTLLSQSSSISQPSCSSSSSIRIPKSSSRTFSTTPTLHADIIRRPRRPYQFTQLVYLSDGSTYTMRTASPMAAYKSTKDTRNHILWQPTDKSLRNVEVDEAGKLAAFRGRFGREFDAYAPPAEEEGQETAAAAAKPDAAGPAAGKDKKGAAAAADAKAAPPPPAPEPAHDAFDLGDLISGYVPESQPHIDKHVVEPPKKAPAGKKGKK